MAPRWWGVTCSVRESWEELIYQDPEYKAFHGYAKTIAIISFRFTDTRLAFTGTTVCVHLTIETIFHRAKSVDNDMIFFFGGASVVREDP